MSGTEGENGRRFMVSQFLNYLCSFMAPCFTDEKPQAIKGEENGIDAFVFGISS